MLLNNLKAAFGGWHSVYFVRVGGIYVPERRPRCVRVRQIYKTKNIQVNAKRQFYLAVINFNKHIIRLLGREYYDTGKSITIYNTLDVYYIGLLRGDICSLTLIGYNID